MYKLTIKVSNKFGVLSRIAGTFSKRGYNIESFHADPMPEDKNTTKIIMTLKCGEIAKSQIIKHLLKLHDVKSVIAEENIC
jgi:acetolactate synthase-1/3 small subunit